MAGRPQKQRDDKTFVGQRLEALLAGENFAEFERKNRLPEATVRRIMNGTDPRISTLSMIAKACNVTLDYFFDGDISQKTSPTVLAGDEPTRRLFSTLSEAHKALAILAESVATGEIDATVAQHSVEEALKIVWQAHGKQAKAGKNQYSKTDTHDTGTA